MDFFRDEEIQKLKAINNELRIRSAMNSYKILENVKKQNREIQSKISYLARNSYTLPFACSKRTQSFCKYQKKDILKSLGQQPDEIFFHFSTVDSQIFSSHISFVFNKSEEFARKLYEYFQIKKQNIYSFSSITFPSFFCYFSSFEFCCNAASMLLEFINLSKDNFYPLVKSFLLSQYTFFDTLWTNFSKKVSNLNELTNVQIFKFLSESLQNSVKLIELPFQRIIIAVSQIDPASKSISFLIRVLVYKTAKLYLKYSPLFVKFRHKNTVLSVFKRYGKEPVTLEANHILSIFLSASDLFIETLPTLIDGIHNDHLPLLISEYDTIEYSRIAIPPQTQRLMFLSYSKDISEIRKSIFSLFNIELYVNRRFRSSFKTCIVPKINVDCYASKFPEDKLKGLEAEYQQNKEKDQASPYRSKYSEVYSLYKSSVEMNEKIDILNQSIELSFQYHLMQRYLESLNSYYFLVLSHFLDKFETLPIGSYKGVRYVRDELKYLISIKGNNTHLVIPYLIHVLNQFNCDLSNWATPEISKRYIELTSKKTLKEFSGFLSSKSLDSILSNLIFDKSLRLGDRMLLLLQYLKDSNSFFLEMKDKITDISQFHCYMLISSHNGLLPGTIMMLENLVFQDLLFTNNFDFQTREQWCVMLQSLLNVLMDDTELLMMCSSIHIDWENV